MTMRIRQGRAAVRQHCPGPQGRRPLLPLPGRNRGKSRQLPRRPVCPLAAHPVLAHRLPLPPRDPVCQHREQDPAQPPAEPLAQDSRAPLAVTVLSLLQQHLRRNLAF
jgi:hypothetical protein